MSGPDAIYDRIGVDYSNLRKADPRIAAQIHAALGDAQTVLNVGAGTGNYEPGDRQVTALEPSAEMIAQRPPGSAPVVQGHAENLPFSYNSFDAAMAVLTVHHWTDQPKGLREMRRVTRGPVVILTFDPAFRPWLTDYIPQQIALDEAQMPPMSDYAMWLGPVEVSPVPVPKDCTDGFLYAYWRRPEAYLDPRLRRGSSSFWVLDGVEQGLAGLSRDLEDGTWASRYRHLLDLEELDIGLRMVVTK